ncbi:MAG: CHRD domain-containing protein [Betaproteobacteria bacterium]
MASMDRQAMHWLLAVGTALAVAACGGGGGSSNAAIPANATTKNVTLNGAQVNPGVTTASSGNGFISVDEQSGAVSGTISTFGINATSANLHEGAAGTNGATIVELTQAKSGTWSIPEGTTLTSAQVASFKAGNLYVSMASAANPNGEIRGQVGRMVFFATLTGSQEVPATGSTATGTGRWVFDPDTNTLSGTETVSGMNATVSHFHAGAAGATAPVAIPFTGGPTTWTLAPTKLTDTQAAALLAGNFYANAHSAANPSGEIRGQVYLPTKCTTLSGAQESPPNSSGATGSACVGVNPDTKAVAGRIETQGIEGTVAHIHQGPVGQVSPVIVPMTQTSPGVWTTAANAAFTDAQLIAFITGGTYVNVHSAALPVGEIRGQLVTGQ